MVQHQDGYYQGESIAVGIPDLPRLDGALISHDHYDHCDLAAFATYRDRSLPLFVAERVVDPARRHGFHNVTALKPWEEAGAGGVIVTATPRQARRLRGHLRPALRSGGRVLRRGHHAHPELGEIPQRLGHISLALLPINGLHIRPANNMHVVMNVQ